VLAQDALQGISAVVTGAGSGIGRTAAVRLAELGADVVGIGRRTEALSETRELCPDPSRFHPRAVDVRDREAITAVLDDVGQEMGIDSVINSAGGQFFSPARSISSNGWRSVMSLNLDAIFWTCSAAYPYLANSRRGSVVNVSLSGVERGSRGLAHSIAARSGVLGLTRTLALEWAPQRIRLNCVAPGTVTTAALTAEGDRATIERFIAATPLGRATEVAEVAELISFLVSPAGSMITGQLVHLDGGAALGPGLHAIES